MDENKSKTLLTIEDIPILNQKLKGWNVIRGDNQSTINSINNLIRKNKWKINDLKIINVMIKDGWKPALDHVFLSINSHGGNIKNITEPKVQI